MLYAEAEGDPEHCKPLGTSFLTTMDGGGSRSAENLQTMQSVLIIDGFARIHRVNAIIFRF